jgi:hypothetical protein
MGNEIVHFAVLLFGDGEKQMVRALGKDAGRVAIGKGLCSLENDRHGQILVSK